MKIFVVNCGSSSLKYQFIDTETREVLASGLAERIGPSSTGEFTHKPLGKEPVVKQVTMSEHSVAVSLALEHLANPDFGVVSSLGDIDAIGHRVVHGGVNYSESVLIDEAAIDVIKGNIPLSPLHNPANLMGIEACARILPSLPQVAVFDTAFHQTMPEVAYVYPIPYEYYEKHKLRKYGFHGTSHRYVAMRAIDMLQKAGMPTSRIITCHLGNGSSCAAVLNGKCIDTSMGLTPLEGLAMGTRSGSIDPAIIKFLCETEGLSLAEVDEILNKKSGMYGISKGLSNDFRDLIAAAEGGNALAQLALDIFFYRVRAVIGSYAAALGGVDAIVFTAGVGENSSFAREKILEGTGFLGVELDYAANNSQCGESDVSTPGAKARVLVVPTNEELMIALDTQQVVNNSSK